MLPDDRYQLIDFGDGRKLESLAGHIVDRPSPAADRCGKRDRSAWRRADSFFDRDNKTWTHHRRWPDDLSVDCGPFRMPLRPTPFGHIGLFPEQAPNWKWLARPSKASQPGAQQANALNLFAYTGASTMAMVAAGYEVVHVDAAKANVQAARAAARLNGWEEHPIRYIVDDAAKFAAREIRRKRHYHAIVLDPPTYGHGPKGKTWRLERDLWPLLDDCLELLVPESFRLLITGHSQEIDQSDLCKHLVQSRFLSQDVGMSRLRIESGRSQLTDTFGRSLDAGFSVRVETIGRPVD